MDTNQLRAAGFSDTEIGEYQKLSSAGFSDDEIIQHYSSDVAPARKTSGATVTRKENPPTMGGRAIKAAQRIGRTAYNIGPDAVEAAQGLAGFIAHPVKSLGEIGEAIGGAAYDVTHMSDEQKAALKQKAVNAAKDPLGTIGAVSDKIGEAVEQHPVDAALMFVTPNAPKVVKGATQAVTDVIKPSASVIEKSIGKTITTGVEKGIRPSVAGKGTFSMSQKYLGDAQDAVEHIVENRGNLRLTSESGDIVSGELPKNLKQFSEAIEQTKRGIFEQYNDLTVQAGRGRATVDLAPISKELINISKDTKLKKFAPGISQYAEKRAGEILTDGSAIGVTDAQDAIAIMNQSLESFYKNPTYENASRAYIDSMVANNLRRSLDKVIETEVGPGYAELKKSYGSLKAIEKDVSHRATVDARKNVKGLLDFSDIFSGSTAVHGILSMNPSLVTSGMIAKMLSTLYKIKNDPNRIIGNMFTKAEKLIQKRDKMAPKAKPTVKTPPTSTPKSAIPARPNGELVSGRLSLKEASGTPSGGIADPYATRMAPYRQANNPDEYFGDQARPYIPPVQGPSIDPDFLGDDGIFSSLMKRRRIIR